MDIKYPVEISLSLNEDNLLEDCLKIIKAVKPQWKLETVKSKIYTEGTSNRLVGFFVDKNDIVLVRIYGQNTDTMIDRKAEIDSIKLLHEKGCGPQLYAIFENGISYGFVSGNTLSMEDCRNPKIYPLVAAEMAKIHSTIPIKQAKSGDSTKPKSQLWEKLRNFDRLIKEICILKENDVLIKRLLGLGINISNGFKNEIDELEKLLEDQNMPVTFCHNDLNLPNTVYNESERKVSFIDFEWAMANYSAFDIANHFIEFAGIENPDFSKCPDRSFKSKWIAEYLKHLHLDNNFEFSQNTFENWVELCFPFSHLIWALWAIVQAQNSTIDFDFSLYASHRYSEYVKSMKNIRSSVEANVS